MKVVKFLSQVDQNKCNGDKRCEKVCPTGAIRVFGKRAEVDKKKCVACSKCWDACREDAIQLVQRSEPMTVGIDPQSVNQDALRELCQKARMMPDQPLCVCNATLAKEVAAAVLMGAKTPEEVTLMTGARAGCGIYCMSPVLKMLKAHGIQLMPPEGHQWYDLTLDLWDVPEEVEGQYPVYHLKEDKRMFIEMQEALIQFQEKGAK
jgi:Fe-S-cluster-containing hydrogenase component 2